MNAVVNPKQSTFPKAEQMNFRALFCLHFGCDEKEFESRALKLFLHSPWSAMADNLGRILPSLVKSDRDIIRFLGGICSESNFNSDVRGIREDYVRKNDFGFLRKRLRLRLSRERILKLSRDLWK